MSPPTRSPLPGLAATAVLAAAIGAAPAAAGPRRPGLYGGGELGAELVSIDDQRGGGFVFIGHVGWLVANVAKLGFEAQGLGGEAWVDGSRRVDAVILGAARLWLADRVSITLGLGLTLADDASDHVVGGSAAAGATFGVELRRWRTSVLSLRAHGYGGTFDDASAIHVGVTLGFEWYGLTTPTP